MKTAVIIGATGLVGSHLLDQILDHHAYHKVTIVVRKPIDKSHSKLQQHVIDFDQLLADANQSDWQHYQTKLTADDVFCCLGTTIKVAGSKDAFRRVDYDYPLAIAKLCRHFGAKQWLLISSIGADATNNNFYLQVKGQLEQALTAVGFDSLQILQPSLLLGKRGQTRILEGIGQLLAPLLNLILTGNMRPYRPIEATMVASAMLNIAMQNESGVFRYTNELLTAKQDG